MAKLLLLFIFLASELVAWAQQDPVLMRIDDKEIFCSEFVRYYNKYGASAGAGRKALEASVNRFIDFRLKIRAAEIAGLDTFRTFRDAQNGYRHNLIRLYLTDENAAVHAARQHYDKALGNRHAGQVYVKHIFKYLPQNASNRTLQAAEAMMDSIYSALVAEGANPSLFDAFVERFSDEKKAFWVERTQMPIEFEKVTFALKMGEVSSPFLTPQGIHIVKAIGQREKPSFEQVKERIINAQTRSYETDKGTQVFVERLKKEYGYVPDKTGIDELLAKGTTSHTLFTLAGKAYCGKDFARFVAAYPAGVRRQLEAFTAKTILDYENTRLESKYSELRMRMQEFRDSMLLAAVTYREVGKKSVEDEAGLSAYFEAHRSDFHWDKPRYRGIVLHCTTKRVARQVRRFLKQIPEEEWMDAIRLTFNAGETPKVQAEQGLFAPGDNVYVDDLVFKGEKAPTVMSFPFTVVQGRKQKGPEYWQMVREPLIAAYRSYLETCWVTKLRASSKVEIDQEVLKTVN